MYDQLNTSCTRTWNEMQVR